MQQLVVTPEEVLQLQQIRDRRLAGLNYQDAKTNFFNNIRTRYKIETKGKTRIKIETEKLDRLGVVQYCGNNKPVLVAEAIT